MKIIDAFCLNTGSLPTDVTVAPWDYTWEEWPTRVGAEGEIEDIHDLGLRRVKFVMPRPTRKIVEEIIKRADRARKTKTFRAYAKWFVKTYIKDWEIEVEEGGEPDDTTWESARDTIAEYLGEYEDLATRLAEVYFDRWRTVEKKTN